MFAAASTSKLVEIAVTEEHLGSVGCPSGSLVVVDFGLMGGWSRKVATSVTKLLARGGGASSALDDGNLIALPGLPREPLEVVGVRIGSGRWANLWRHVELKLGSTPVAKVEELGEVYVERARLMFADPSVLDAWQHEDTLDGLADIAFWGRDKELVAKASGATRLDDGEWGFADLPLDAAKAKYAELGELVARNDWFVRAEPREHDHHYLLLKAAKASPLAVGELELRGARLLGLLLPHGDGASPVQRCRDAHGALVGVRVVLGTDDALATLDAVND